LAPGCNYNQHGGVVVGKVVVANVQFALQINVPNCPDTIKPIDVPNQVTTPCKQGDTVINYTHLSCYREGDKLKFPNGDTYQIISSDSHGNCHLDRPLSQNYGANTRTIVRITDPTELRPFKATAGAASIAASIALLLAASLFLMF